MDSDLYLYLNGTYEAQQLFDLLDTINPQTNFTNALKARLGNEIHKAEQENE